LNGLPPNIELAGFYLANRTDIQTEEHSEFLLTNRTRHSFSAKIAAKDFQRRLALTVMRL
jgi:hypothetical protein